jgi:ketosteroid isomerase-like protein
MSEENVEIVRRLLADFDNRDWLAAAAPLHADIAMDTTRAPVPELSGIYRGLDEVSSFWREWLEAWGEIDIGEPEFIDGGDQVVTWTTYQELRGRGSGVQVSFPAYAWVSTLRDGKVVRATLYIDRTEALEAAGLSE